MSEHVYERPREAGDGAREAGDGAREAGDGAHEAGDGGRAAAPPVKGWIEAAARVVRALIASGRAQDNLQVILGAVDPDSGSALVRALLHTDPALPLAVLGALPDGVNAAAEIGAALARELSPHPPALLHQTLRSLVGRVRFSTLGAWAGHLLALGVKLRAEASGAPDRPLGAWEDFSAGADEVVRREAGVGAAEALATLTLASAEAAAAALERDLTADTTLARAIRALARGLGELLERHPALREQIIAPLVRPLLATATAPEEARHG